MKSRIRVMIADDHAMVREGVRHVIEDADDMEVVAEVSDGRAALAALEAHQPGVLLLDLSMPDLSGLRVVEGARVRSPETRIVILSMHSDGESVSAVLAAGATSYLLKDEAGPSELRHAVRAAGKGEAFFTPGVAAIMAQALQSRERDDSGPTRLAALTARERDVLRGIAEGLSNKQLASRLAIGRRTVETHRESLMRKLDIRTVAGLTRFAIEAGLIDVELP